MQTVYRLQPWTIVQFCSQIQPQTYLKNFILVSNEEFYLTLTLFSRLYKYQFVNKSCYYLQLSRKSGKNSMEIKSTVVDWTFMPWKLNPRPWKCFKEHKCCFFGQIWENNAMKREKSDENYQRGFSNRRCACKKTSNGLIKLINYKE